MTDGRKLKWASRLFPTDHDFFELLAHQAAVTSQGIEAFCRWLKEDGDASGVEVTVKEREADDKRKKLQEVLVEAFSTPIERGDLYDLSRQLDDMLDHARDTIHEASALGVVPPQPQYARFAPPLADAMAAISKSIGELGKNPAAADDHIPVLRRATREVRMVYYDCLRDVAREPDVNLALRRREVYHHLRDVGGMMDRTADVLHRVIVRLI